MGVTEAKKPRRRRTRFVLGCMVVAGVLILPSLIGALVGVTEGIVEVGDKVCADPTQKARILAEGISMAMNSTAFASLVTLVVGVGLGARRLVRRRRRRQNRSGDQDGEGESGPGEPPSSEPPEA